jgi:cytoskeleton protein RodZ
VDTFGEQLKHERESRKVALDEIARSTKIRVRYLQALEDGQHERLPGIVFAKGYVRAYAETIGADPDRLVTAYVDEQRSLGRLETEASQEKVLEALAAAVQDHPDPASRRIKTALIGVVATVAIALVGWFVVRPLMNRDAGSTAQPVPQAATMMPIRTPAAAAEIEADGPPAEEPVATPEPVLELEPAIVEQPEVVEVATAQLEPENAPGGVADAPELIVPECGVGTGVQQRDLVGESSAFETGTQVVFWNRVLGGESGRSVRHVWSHEGSVTGTVELSIGAAHWRTYSKQTLRRSGEWTVEAQDEDGNVLARRTFVATPA